MLSKTKFKFEGDWAAVLPGSTEGIYGFIAANYASGVLQQPNPDPETLMGVVELGGASLQVCLCSHLDRAKSLTHPKASLAGL